MNDNTLLYRQVHPSFIQGDTISSLVFSSQAFRPTPKDEGRLSVYNGEVFDAEGAFEHYTGQMQLSSGGVVAVACEECSVEELEVIEDNDPFPGHCSIDFRPFSNNQIKKKAEKLKAKAAQRGWLFREN